MSKKFYRIPKVVKNQGNEVKEFTKKKGKAFFEGIYFKLILVHNNIDL